MADYHRSGGLGRRQIGRELRRSHVGDRVALHLGVDDLRLLLRRHPGATERQQRRLAVQRSYTMTRAESTRSAAMVKSRHPGAARAARTTSAQPAT